MIQTTFNTAGFLDHQFFLNPLVPFRASFSDGSGNAGEKDFPPYTIHNFELNTVLGLITAHSESKELGEALKIIPNDVLVFLSKYIFPAGELAKSLEREKFYKHYETVEADLEELMEKYGAN
jgi:hypothetical protein